MAEIDTYVNRAKRLCEANPAHEHKTPEEKLRKRKRDQKFSRKRAERKLQEKSRKVNRKRR